MKNRLKKIIQTKIMPSIKPAKGEMIDSVRVRIGSRDKYLQEAAFGKHIYSNAEYQMLKMSAAALEDCQLVVRDGALFLKKDQSKKASTLGLSSKGENNAQAFVMDKDGSLYITTHTGKYNSGPGSFNVSHASFLNGKPAEMAGTITILDGKITKITNNSGHYAPSALDMYRGIKKLGNNLFAPDCKIFIKNDKKELSNFIREMETIGSSGKMLHEELREERVQESKDKILLLSDVNGAIDKFVKLGADEDKLIDLFLYCVDGNRTKEMGYFFSRLEESGELNRFINMELDEDGVTPLHYVAYMGNAEIAKILLDKGVNLEAELEGETVLGHSLNMYDVQSNLSNIEEMERLRGIIFTLVENGANIDNVKDKPIIKEITSDKEKVKEIIGLFGDEEKIVKALDGLEKEALAKVLNYRDEQTGNSLLHIVAEKGSAALCNKLIEKGADVFASNTLGKTPLNLAKAKLPRSFKDRILNYFRKEKYPRKQDMEKICNNLVQKEKEIEKVKLGAKSRKTKASENVPAPSKTPYVKKFKNFFQRGV